MQARVIAVQLELLAWRARLASIRQQWLPQGDTQHAALLHLATQQIRFRLALFTKRQSLLVLIMRNHDRYTLAHAHEPSQAKHTLAHAQEPSQDLSFWFLSVNWCPAFASQPASQPAQSSGPASPKLGATQLGPTSQKKKKTPIEGT